MVYTWYIPTIMIYLVGVPDEKKSVGPGIFTEVASWGLSQGLSHLRRSGCSQAGNPEFVV